MAEKEEPIKIPTDLLVNRFAAARAQEIKTLTELIENPSNTKLIFQKLPCHMRRRAMSHNPNRMPRLLREAHKAQMEKSGIATDLKRPRRKYRRRPSNLLKEYTKRSQKNVWLETHIWHAKRFHMCTLWNFRLPKRSCSRSFRFCYRASVQNCLLTDISYLYLVEVQGPVETIFSGLKHLCDPRTGLTFQSTFTLKGNYEKQIMLYQPDQYPFNAIGQISFMWHCGDFDSTIRTLRLWIHPAFYEEVLSALGKVFEIDGTSENEEKVKLVVVEDSLNRFRLRGPASFSVISSLFDPDSSSPLPNFNQLPPNFILGVTIRDPRLTLPGKRTKPVDNISESPFEFKEQLSQSDLW
nr:EOG090X07PD [Cyclestheria hislopi]